MFSGITTVKNEAGMRASYRKKRSQGELQFAMPWRTTCVHAAQAFGVLHRKCR